MIGDRSANLRGLKRKDNLPLSVGELTLAVDKAKGLGVLEAAMKKVELMERYAAVQRVLMANLAAGGMKVANSISAVVDLQAKLLELEAKLEGEGKNPLQDQAWMKARSLLGGEIQFLHKHGLDEARFQKDVDKASTRLDDDIMFTVVGEKDGKEE